MDTKMVEDTRKNWASRSSEKLVQIWKENDQKRWSDSAIQADTQIPTERRIEIPPQGLARPAKQDNKHKGRTKNYILTAAVGIAGIAAFCLLSREGIIPTRGHELVLLVGIGNICAIISRGINVAAEISVGVVGTAVILALIQMQLLLPINALFAAFALWLLLGVVDEILNRFSKNEHRQ